MWSRKKRLLAVLIAGFGVAVGVGLEAILDPVEDTVLAPVGLVLSIAVLGSAVCHWFGRRLDEAGEIDERTQAIERRASRYSHGTLIGGVGVLALVMTSLPWIEPPVGLLLWALLIGSVVIHEGSIEYYRRRM